MSRRELLKGAAAATGGLASGVLSPSVLRALAAPATPGKLSDIEHVVIFINENRSFDHYFGRYPAVRGFSDPHALPGVFSQADPANTTVAPIGRVLPFHLDIHASGSNSECTHDISHEWIDQHKYWNNGAMDRWVVQHNLVDGTNNGFLTMGYYQGSPQRDNSGDIDYFWALADAFTIGDSYHCSVIGPTDPNRLYSMSAWLDPAGTNGGPALTTLVSGRPAKTGTYTWTTYPERLTAAGVSWKVYQTADGLLGDNVLTYFKNYHYETPGPDALWVNAFGSQAFPTDFMADCAAGTLPQVSWVLCSLVQSEHPPAPPPGGEYALSQVVNALTASPLWPKSALFYTYDENGGFFDHVPPPTAPPGTRGEYLTGAGLADPDAHGVAGPIGLGFRVPLIVVSPFSRGGFVATSNPTAPDPAHTYDHTSLLRFLETRFGVEVPNLSAWRRSVTGDLTDAFNFVAPDASAPPPLPATAPIDQTQIDNNCEINSTVLITDVLQSTGGTTVAFPSQQVMPAQYPGSRPQPSGPVGGPPAPTATPQPAAAAGGGAMPNTSAAPPVSAMELVGVAAIAAGAWWLRRRSEAPDDEQAREPAPPD